MGSGVGLALASPQHSTAFLTLGAIYFFAAQAFGFTVGGYLVGRLIGPETETAKEEEFRAAAHGFVMWALTIVASLLLVGLSSVVAGSTLYAGSASRAAATPAGYWEDALFRPASNSPSVMADKAEAGRILAMDMAAAGGANDADSSAIARLVAADAGMSHVRGDEPGNGCPDPDASGSRCRAQGRQHRQPVDGLCASVRRRCRGGRGNLVALDG